MGLLGWLIRWLGTGRRDQSSAHKLKQLEGEIEATEKIVKLKDKEIKMIERQLQRYEALEERGLARGPDSLPAGERVSLTDVLAEVAQSEGEKRYGKRMGKQAKNFILSQKEFIDEIGEMFIDQGKKAVLEAVQKGELTQEQAADQLKKYAKEGIPP